MAVKLLYNLREMEWDDANGRYSSGSETYLVTDAADEEAAIAAAVASSPDELCDMPRGNVTLEERGQAAWIVKVNYAYNSAGGFSSVQLPPETVTFDGSAATVHITNSRNTVHRYGSAPNYGGAIDVQNHEVRGCDVYYPNPTMNIVHCFSAAQMTTAFRNRLLFKTCHVNDATFRGFAAGELLYLTSRITQQGTGRKRYYQVDYTFLISPNQEDMEFGSLKGIDKKGWQYLWLRYKDEVDSGNLVTPPVGAYVEKVYLNYDFKLLGLSANG